MHGRSLSTIPSDFLGELIVDRRDHTGVADFTFGDESHEESSDFSDEFTLDPDSDRQHPDSADVSERVFSPRTGSVRDQKSGRSESRSKSPAKGLRLTTAAALQAGTNEAVELRMGFSVGMQVRHPRYGLGTVIDVSGMARRRTVTVDFVAENRRERFVEDKCPLQPVGLR